MEEQAFAEDTAGALGGCVWPPRSYSCSFCRREFRSAQALGGHMNVHRRDRARLKQSSNSPTEIVPQSACTFLYSNPNPEFSDSGPLVSPLSHVLRVSSPPTEDKEKTSTTLSFFSPISEKNFKGDIVSSNHPSRSSFQSETRDQGLDLIQNDEKKSDVGVDQESRAQKEDCVMEDLSKSLNFVVCQMGNNASSDEEVGSCKRRRIEAKPLSFLPILSAVERCLPQCEVLKLCSDGSTDDLDLELRLGDAPKVK